MLASVFLIKLWFSWFLVWQVIFYCVLLCSGHFVHYVRALQIQSTYLILGGRHLFRFSTWFLVYSCWLWFKQQLNFLSIYRTVLVCWVFLMLWGSHYSLLMLPQEAEVTPDQEGCGGTHYWCPSSALVSLKEESLDPMGTKRLPRPACLLWLCPFRLFHLLAQVSLGWRVERQAHWNR